ncbi:VacJ family lipoprotein [Azovibrio restrictus]|jgi:phospholipid-binding lipoprotein MlaA|uniref:MlaA family lipoprotein n=1 Tax=Azovibrio restrictus TaxID=146938 RepID=UPI0026EBF8FA|nr:VacJ family lipoprotein [Azovibrio restrictus]
MNIDIQRKSALRGWRGVLALAALALLAGCAGTTRAPSDKDPYEGFNRAMFEVHEGIDKAALKPLAKGYDAVVPLPARMGVHNFYENVWDLNRGANALFQGKGEEGMTGFGRLLINSTVGIFGLFDVASELGLDQGEEDFGQTLAVWGVSDGPYVFLPIIGPNTARDLVGWGVDQVFYPLWWDLDDVPLRNSLIALRAVEYRARLLPADKVVEEAALDKYAYIRSAYLQRRHSQIHDGRPPREQDDN